MKDICRNCHFLAKEHRDENTGVAHSFSVSQKERDEFDSGNFTKIKSYYSLKCHHGVWDEGLSPGKEKRKEIITQMNRENQCFFFPFTPGMLFDVAETLQHRAIKNQQLKRAHYFKVISLIIACLGLIFAFLNCAKCSEWATKIWHWIWGYFSKAGLLKF